MGHGERGTGNGERRGETVPAMRHTRKRFTTPRVRRLSLRDHAIKTVEGVSQFRQSRLGRLMRDELLREQWQLQSHICPDCGAPITADNSRLRLAIAIASGFRKVAPGAGAGGTTVHALRAER